MKLKIKINWSFVFSILVFFVVSTQILFPLKINIYIANLFLYMLLSMYILYMLLTKKYKIYLNSFLICYFFFVLWSGFSLFWSVDINFTFPLLIRILFLFLTLFVMYNIFKNFNNEFYLLYGVIVAAYFNFFIALGIINYTTPFTNNLRFTGTLARSNDVAIVMIITLVSAFILLNEERISKIWKKIALLSIPLSLYVIFLTVSKKGVIFGGLLTLLYFIDEIKNNFKKFLSIFIISSISIFFLFKDNIDIIVEKFNRLLARFSEFDSALNGYENFGSTAERLRFIKEGIEYLSNHPFHGYGLNTFIVMDSSHHYSHNNYIEILVGTGIIGFILYYCIYLMMFVKLFSIKSKRYKKIRNILLFSLIVFLFMDTALVSYSYKIIIFMLFFIFIYIEKLSEESKKVENEEN